MRILLVEDDYLFSKEIEADINREFPNADVDIIATEATFLARFPDIEKAPPSVIILDLLLPWADASSDEPDRAEQRSAGVFRGGLRCLMKLRESTLTNLIPVIVHSAGGMLPRDTPDNVMWVPKSGNPAPLLAAIRSVLFLGISDGEQRVFVVHGHDEQAKETVARFLERLAFRPIILQEQPNRGAAILEKLESNSRAAFAVVLLTPDDVGAEKGKTDDLKMRARQNVILELGFFLGRLGTARVCALLKGSVEIPSDYQGVLYVNMDTHGAWRTQLASEMRTAGLRFDSRKLLG